MSKKNDDILTLKQAGNYLKISREVMYELAKNRGLPCFKIGGQWRFRKSSLDRWMEKQERRRGAS